MQNFNYHSHTYRCGHADFGTTDEDYIIDYIKMGFQKVAFTDHAPEKNVIDKRPNMRMNYSQKDEYLNNLDRLKQKYCDKIQIESGFEVEYLPNNNENLIELKSATDKLILGQHFIYDNNHNLKVFGHSIFSSEELIKYATYIDEACSLNIPNIIAHPDIYMLNRPTFGKIESKLANMICSSAEKYNIPLEINLNNIFNKTYYENRHLNNDSLEFQRLKLKNVFYPCKEFWDIATNYNVKILYGLDTHHKAQIPLYHELLGLSNEIIGDDILSKLNFIKN